RRGVVLGVLTELVGGEAEHGEAVRGELLLELLQPGELRGERALGRGVDDQDHAPAVLGHRTALTVDGERREVVEARGGHGLLTPGKVTCASIVGRQARKSSTSSRVGALSVPRRVTAIAAAAFARVAADSQSAPSARSASSTPVWVSPAPLVSTGVCGKAGIPVPRPWWKTKQPLSPSRTITTESGRMRRRIASGVSSRWSRSVSARASSAFEVHTVVRASTRRCTSA